MRAFGIGEPSNDQERAFSNVRLWQEYQINTFSHWSLGHVSSLGDWGRVLYYVRIAASRTPTPAMRYTVVR
jgi:hypothetical protein